MRVTSQMPTRAPAQARSTGEPRKGDRSGMVIREVRRPRDGAADRPDGVWHLVLERQAANNRASSPVTPGLVRKKPFVIHKGQKLLVNVEQGHDGDVVQLLAALEEGDLNDEEVANQLAPELLDEVAGGGGGTTCSGGGNALEQGRLGENPWRGSVHTSSNDVVDDQHFLALLDDALLHLEVVGAVLLHVLGGDTRAGQLALLADGDEAGVEAQGHGWAEQEATGVEADDDVRGDGVAIAAEVLELKLQGAEQGGVDLGVEEPGHDVQEVDARDGEVGKAAEGLLQAYLCTGEFGGGGGGGGGLSSRGMVGRCVVTTRARGRGGQVALGIRG